MTLQEIKDWVLHNGKVLFDPDAYNFGMDVWSEEDVKSAISSSSSMDQVGNRYHLSGGKSQDGKPLKVVVTVEDSYVNVVSVGR